MLTLHPLHAATLLPSEVPPTPLGEWQTMHGDSLIVDTHDNVGFLMHEDGGYTSFPVVTGQRRVVRYIGRTYDARTPSGAWQILSQEIKGDRTTFGKRGRFLRLSRVRKNGTEETSYGIHSHASIGSMLASQDRYRSMGCVLVSDPVLDTIIATFDLNDHMQNVQIVAGFGEELVTEPVLHRVLDESADTGL